MGAGVEKECKEEEAEINEPKEQSEGGGKEGGRVCLYVNPENLLLIRPAAE